VGRPKLHDDGVRQELLRHAIELLEREGPPAVRARRVAAGAGTSTAAMYELFGDKSGLIRAVFFEGFTGLLDALLAVPRTDSPRRDLMSLMEASREFAVAHPMLFEVMYGRPFAEFDPSTEESELGKEIYRLTVKAVGRWLRSQDSALSPVAGAHVLVATHRGLVANELAGLLGRSESTRAARYELGVETILAGLLAIAPADPASGPGNQHQATRAGYEMEASS
jgi:AcrR family transcriptional regulator